MKPNIVIIMADHFRADALHHMGNDASYTPNLDSLVENDAVSFRNNYCQNPVCSPSRCSIMSGWYPHTNGHRTMHYLLNENEPVLLRTLKNNDYKVCWAGKNDFADMSKEGWQNDYCDQYIPWRPFIPEYFDMKGNNLPGLELEGKVEDNKHYYSFYEGISSEDQLNEKGECIRNNPACGDVVTVDGACKYIEEQEDADNPFCVYLALFSPHPAYQVEQEWMDKIDRSKLPKRISNVDAIDEIPMVKGIKDIMQLDRLNEDDWDDIRTCFLAMCAKVDDWVGRLIDSLKKIDAYDNTVFVFMSDHGDYTGDFDMVEKTQNTFQECLVNTPLVIKPTKNTEFVPGIRDTITENLDLVATIEDLVGIPLSLNNFSKSLKNSLMDPSVIHRKTAYCEGGRLKNEYHTSEYQSKPAGENHRYWPRLSVQSDDGDSFKHGKAIMLRNEKYKYVYRLYEKDELYNMELDPTESHNLIDDLEYKEVLFELKDELSRFLVETGDVVPMTKEEENLSRQHLAKT